MGGEAEGGGRVRGSGPSDDLAYYFLWPRQ